MCKQNVPAMIVFMLLFCGCSYSTAHEQHKNKYPLKQDQARVISIIDMHRKNFIVGGLKKLKLSEVSSDVVKDIGYEPDAYYAAPNKSLDKPPSHYIMTYFFQRELDESGHLKNKEISIIFDRDERLTSIMFSGVSEVKQTVDNKIPVIDMAEH